MLRVRMPPRHRHRRARPGARLAKGLFVAVVYFFCALLQMDTECYTNNTATCKEGRRQTGREGELEGNKVEKVREEAKGIASKPNHAHRNQAKRNQRTEQRRKNNAKVWDKFQTRGLDKGLPWCWADSAMRNFWPALQLPLPTHSTLDPLSTSPTPQIRAGTLMIFLFCSSVFRSVRFGITHAFLMMPLRR